MQHATRILMIREAQHRYYLRRAGLHEVSYFTTRKRLTVLRKQRSQPSWSIVNAKCNNETLIMLAHSGFYHRLLYSEKIAHFIPIINKETLQTATQISHKPPFVFRLHNNDSALANHETG